MFSTFLYCSNRLLKLVKACVFQYLTMNTDWSLFWPVHFGRLSICVFCRLLQKVNKKQFVILTDAALLAQYKTLNICEFENTRGVMVCKISICFSSQLYGIVFWNLKSSLMILCFYHYFNIIIFSKTIYNTIVFIS